MVIIKINMLLPRKDYEKLRANILEQAAAGQDLILPPWCEVVADVPDGTEIKVIEGGGDCNDCGKSDTCPHVPKWGGIVRINCPLWRAKG